jgi:hypothetical protein
MLAEATMITESTVFAEPFWPLLQSILQITLGGAIALITAWFIHRMKNKNESTSPGERRLLILEEISREVGYVNHSFARYSALVIESTRFGKTWPAARKIELDRVNTELVEEFRKLADAEAKLLMLGEKTMEKTLRLYASKIALFRKQVYVGRQDISEQEIAHLKATILTLREQFYDLLSRRYDRLLAA